MGKLKISVVWFACLRDLAMLQESMNSVRRCLPLGAELVVSFDQSERDDAPIVGGWDGVRLAWTDFPRGLSLNQSPACVEGMLDVFDGLDGDVVVKMDSDTIMRGDPREVLAAFDLVGEEGVMRFGSKEREVASYRFAKGHAYALSREVIQRACAHREDGLLEAADAHTGGLLSHSAQRVTWPEDGVMSQVVQMLQPDPRRVGLFPERAPIRWCADYDWATEEVTAPLSYFVNCGNLAEPKQERCERVAKVMRRVA